MSHQPSTVDNLKQNANSAYESIAATLSSSAAADKQASDEANNKLDEYTKDAQGQTVKKGGFKDQLSQAARGDGSGSDPQKEAKEASLLEKGVSSIQRTVFGQAPETKEEEQRQTNKGGPPDRPQHDVQVEEFLRDQYHSTSGRGMPDLGKK